MFNWEFQKEVISDVLFGSYKATILKMKALKDCVSYLEWVLSKGVKNSDSNVLFALKKRPKNLRGMKPEILFEDIVQRMEEPHPMPVGRKWLHYVS